MANVVLHSSVPLVSWDANQLLSGEYTGSFYFNGRSKNDRVELIFFNEKDGVEDVLSSSTGKDAMSLDITLSLESLAHVTQQYPCNVSFTVILLALYQQQLRLAAEIGCRKPCSKGSKCF